MIDSLDQYDVATKVCLTYLIICKKPLDFNSQISTYWLKGLFAFTYLWCEHLLVENFKRLYVFIGLFNN